MGLEEAALAAALDARERAEDRPPLPGRKQGCGATRGKRPNCAGALEVSDPFFSLAPGQGGAGSPECPPSGCEEAAGTSPEFA